MCWFDLHNENWCLAILPLTWLSAERKSIIFSHSTAAASIPLSLFWVVVNNDRNAHGLLSSFPLSVPASLTRSLDLIPAPMLMARLASAFVCLLAQTNVLISSELGVSLWKLLFIKRIDSAAAGIKNTCSKREIKSMFLWNACVWGYVCEAKYSRRLELRRSQYSRLMRGIKLYIWLLTGSFFSSFRRLRERYLWRGYSSRCSRKESPAKKDEISRRRDEKWRIKGIF